VIGAFLSRYRIIGRLGAGATAEVYRAEDTRLRRQVALKVLRGDAPAEDARALLVEARAASALAHPNIAVIYEVDHAAVEGVDVAFIAMELVTGRTLADLIAAGTLSLEQSLDIVRQAAEGLAHAHARGLVHRDIKPANLMVTESGLVKVLDFGLARATRTVFAGAEDETTSGDVDVATTMGPAGTLPYMSPEQVRGDVLDGRSDMFSLGIVLYELVCGRRPFEHTNPVVLLEALLGAVLPPFRSRFDDPRARQLEPVLRRMLARDRAQRYESLRDVAAVVTAVARGDETGPAERPADQLAVGAFVNITANPDDDWLGTGLAETLAAGFSQLDGHIAVPRARVHELMRMLAQSTGESEDALAPRVAIELGARWFVSGGFQRAGAQVRVTATILDAPERRVAGIVKVDGRLDDIFALQDQLVRDIVALLRAVTRSGEVDSASETAVVEAYEAFSKGVINLRTESYESLDRAVWLFERASRLDPSYARAHVELGAAYASKADYLSMPELRERALASLRRALDLQPSSVRAWRELGGVLIARGDETEGLAAIRRALALDPQDAGALGSMGRALFTGLARFRDAVAYFDQALERNPNAGWYALQLAHCLTLLRDFPRGEAAARRAAALQEAELSGQDGVLIVGAWMRLGHLAALQGRHDEAAQHFLHEIELLSRVDHALRNRILVELNVRLGASHLRLGHTRRSQAALDVALEGFERRVRLGADDPFTRYYAACVHALRGDVETTLAMLERCALERRAFTFERARIEPEFDAVRDDARFVRLIGRA
jgi:tetratricopeptide (TPR) repeat protein